MSLPESSQRHDASHQSSYYASYTAASHAPPYSILQPSQLRNASAGPSSGPFTVLTPTHSAPQKAPFSPSSASSAAGSSTSNSSFAPPNPNPNPYSPSIPLSPVLSALSLSYPYTSNARSSSQQATAAASSSPAGSSSSNPHPHLARPRDWSHAQREKRHTEARDVLQEQFHAAQRRYGAAMQPQTYQMSLAHASRSSGVLTPPVIPFPSYP